MEDESLGSRVGPLQARPGPGKEFVAVEDGQTFLSREELDDYRTQKMQTGWADGDYA